MTRKKLSRWLWAWLLAPVLLLAQTGDRITPAASYRDPAWRAKAQALSPNLSRLAGQLGGKFGPGFQLLSAGESATAGLGFWANPVDFGNPARYLGVFARMQFPPPSSGRSFPDTETGRILTIMDAYGKDTITMMAQELSAMNDPQVAGGALIFIYAKKPIGDPGFEQSAEALALFIPRPTLTAFAELRMTVQSLFSQSQMMPVFVGAEQIGNLRTVILQP